ncbi:MAG: T9SS C-terminal target domain-containing protein, partial [Candidatus Zixiibacteriota bacterium]
TNYFNGYHGFKVSFADIDADGDQDAFFTGAQGGVTFLRNLQNTSVSPYTKPRSQRVMDLSLSPQPGNPTVALSFELRAASYVSLRVYDTAGRAVATLVDGWREAGSHTVTFDGSGLASGVYLVRLKAGGEAAVEKAVVLK